MRNMELVILHSYVQIIIIYRLFINAGEGGLTNDRPVLYRLWYYYVQANLLLKRAL
jgi:hypothetical protein